MPTLPPLRHRSPSPGLVWLAAGLPTHNAIAAQRNAALFAAPGDATPSLVSAREVTLLPGIGPVPALATLLPVLRAIAPDTVLRLEWWPDAPLFSDAERRALVAAQPLFVHLVIDQPGAIPEDAATQLRALADAGVPTAATLLLRRGGLDALEPVRDLCLALQRLAVRPYYLVDGAWLGSEQRVPRDAALTIVHGLRGWISGVAVPQLVEETLEGWREPIIPPYVERLDESGVEVVNFEGRRLRYPNPPEKG
jgi:L-lysine 2,3-aminomutase